MSPLAAVGSLSLEAAAAQLVAGGLVAFPTETVYGLGARADSDAAVAAIFSAKGRPADHPLIVHMAGIEEAAHFTPALTGAARQLAQAFWPGPLTLIVPRRPGVATAAAGGQASIGLRVPSHPLALALLRRCHALGVAGVAAPSANRFGRISPTRAAHVLAEFEGRVPVLDGGDCEVGIESTIVDVSSGAPTLLRPGRLTRLAIEQLLGRPLAEPGAHSPRASGTLEAHYAPSVPLRLFDGRGSGPSAGPDAGHGAPPGPAPGALPAAQAQSAAPLAVYSRSAPAGVGFGGAKASTADVVWRRMPDDAAAAAHELFAVLRELDQAGVRQIWVESPPDGPEWEGVRDRLRRAAAA